MSQSGFHSTTLTGRQEKENLKLKPKKVEYLEEVGGEQEQKSQTKVPLAKYKSV